MALAAPSSVKPGDYSALFNRAGCYARVKRYDDAIRDYSEIIDAPTDFSRTVEGKDSCLALTRYYRGELYLWQKQDYKRAVADFTETIRLNPKVDEPVRWARARAYLAQREYAKARDDFEAEAKAHPDHVGSMNQLAWLLATCPDPKCRNGRKALELAERARKLTKEKNSSVLDTLAASFAELGEFEKAAEWQAKAIRLLGSKPGEQVKAMEGRLSLYRAKKPYRAD